jgi:hypothetical protein
VSAEEGGGRRQPSRPRTSCPGRAEKALVTGQTHGPGTLEPGRAGGHAPFWRESRGSQLHGAHQPSVTQQEHTQQEHTQQEHTQQEQ